METNEIAQHNARAWARERAYARVLARSVRHFGSQTFRVRVQPAAQFGLRRYLFVEVGGHAWWGRNCQDRGGRHVSSV